MAHANVPGRRHEHPVHRVHRIGGAVLGCALLVFGGFGLADMPAFFTARGQQVMGMGSNGALAVLSLVVGAVLVLASLRGGRTSSTTSLVVGAAFLLSGFVHLAILDTAANVLAFRLPNVFFSFLAGLVLLTLGAYGRMTGGLAPDNPYARSPRAVPAEGVLDAEHTALVDAEQAVAVRRATAAQQQLLRAERARLAATSYDGAWERYAATHTPADVLRLRAASSAESAIEHRG